METGSIFVQRLLVEMEKGVRPDPTRESEMGQRGDLVLIADDRVPRNQWNMARVVDSRPDSKGQVRSVKGSTATTTLERPIQKLVLILENEKKLKNRGISQPEEP